MRRCARVCVSYVSLAPLYVNVLCPSILCLYLMSILCAPPDLSITLHRVMSLLLLPTTTTATTTATTNYYLLPTTTTAAAAAAAAAAADRERRRRRRCMAEVNGFYCCTAGRLWKESFIEIHCQG